MSLGMLLYALVRWPLVCGLTLLAFILGIRKVAQGNRTGWVLLAACVLMPGYYGTQWVQSKLSPLQRAREIASWPRVNVTAANRPRVLIVHGRAEPFVYFLAETGLFDVFAVEGLNFAGSSKKIWRLEVGPRENCGKDRTERDEMVVLTGWRSCATAVRAESAPKEGLILYTGPLAPHSWRQTRKDNGTRAAWTYELALGTGDDERLVAYDEFVDFPELRFLPLMGPYFEPREPPRHPVAMGPNIDAPELGAFILSALGIDEQAITPPSALNFEEQRAVVDNLTATDQPENIQHALDLIAAAPPNPAFRLTMQRLASNPATSTKMLLRNQPRWCKKVEGLLRYRDALMDGCANTQIPADKCARLGFTEQWLRLCADSSEPIWRHEDKPARRVFIADVIGGQNTKILLTKPAGAIEVRVPSDRGALDIVVRNQGSRVFVFTGAASCIARLTVLENGQTGVVGVDPSRVRFAAPLGTGSWINPAAPFSGDFAKLLGIRPDDILYEHRGDIDLADALAARSSPPCAPSPHATLKSGGTLQIDTSTILTAPPLLPFVRREGVAP